MTFNSPASEQMQLPLCPEVGKPAAAHAPRIALLAPDLWVLISHHSLGLEEADFLHPDSWLAFFLVPEASVPQARQVPAVLPVLPSSLQQ